jgi:hypothetical protein
MKKIKNKTIYLTAVVGLIFVASIIFFSVRYHIRKSDYVTVT